MTVETDCTSVVPLLQIEEPPTVRRLMPPLHQRRLWQQERRLEEECRELNLMIARSYSNQFEAAKTALQLKNSMQIILYLRVVMPQDHCRHLILVRVEKLKRSWIFKHFVQSTFRIYLRIRNYKR